MVLVILGNGKIIIIWPIFNLTESSERQHQKNLELKRLESGQTEVSDQWISSDVHCGQTISGAVVEIYFPVVILFLASSTTECLGFADESFLPHKNLKYEIWGVPDKLVLDCPNKIYYRYSFPHTVV